MVKAHVPSYETCVKLKEAGFPQDTIFGWDESGEDVLFSDWQVFVAAPLLSEIFSELRKSSPRLTLGYPLEVILTNSEAELLGTSSVLWLELNEKGKKDA